MDYQAFESTIHQWAKETKRHPYNRGFSEGTLHIYGVDDGLAYFVFQSPGHQTAIPVGRCSRHILRAVTTFRQRVVLRRSHTSQHQTTVYIHSQLLRFIWCIYFLFPVFLFLFFLRRLFWRHNSWKENFSYIHSHDGIFYLILQTPYSVHTDVQL
jgi:hypothetical protein